MGSETIQDKERLILDLLVHHLFPDMVETTSNGCYFRF